MDILHIIPPDEEQDEDDDAAIKNVKQSALRTLEQALAFTAKKLLKYNKAKSTSDREKDLINHKIKKLDAEFSDIEESIEELDHVSTNSTDTIKHILDRSSSVRQWNGIKETYEDLIQGIQKIVSIYKKKWNSIMVINRCINRQLTSGSQLLIVFIHQMTYLRCIWKCQRKTLKS